MHTTHEPYYHDRLTEWDLCHDFPDDAMYIDGLHAMQCHFMSHNVPVDIPVVRVMNAAHFMLAYAFSNECSGDQMEYDALAYGSVGHDKQVMLVTLIVLAAMLKRTEGFRAGMCRNMLLENRTDDFHEGVTLYDQFLRSAEKHFAEEDFLIDVNTLVTRVQDQDKQIAQLTSENIQLKYTLTTMEKEKPQTIVYNYGTYNDIHDNPYSTIYATAPEEPQKEQAYTPAIPKEGDYNEVREYIALRKKYDEEFRIYWDSHTLKQNCIYLTKEFKWLVDEHSLGANLNRHR